MSITELAVKRPTAIIMGMVLILGLGVVGYVNLGADLFPAVNTPIISIRSTYIGAGAEEIDKDLIKPIEDAVSGVNGIDTIRSTSGTGFGYTIIQFTMCTDMNAAVIDVQKALDGIADKLPKDATRPVMAKYDVNSQPILILSVAGQAHAGGAVQRGRPHHARHREPARGGQRQPLGRAEEAAPGHRGQGGNGLLRGQRDHAAGASCRPTT